jgi:membrane-bound serine protease (ClpP class)
MKWIGSKMKLRSKWLLLVLMVGIGILASPRPPIVQAQDSSPEIVILEAKAVVAPPLQSYIKRGLNEADERNAEALILVLDTPGGSVDSTLEIIQDIRASDVPVIVFIGPRGAGAASAGLLITLAGHGAAMAPETAIGASSPINIDGSDIETTAQKKAKEFLGAEARSLAERRGEAAVDLANDAVFEAKAVSNNEALEAGLVDFVVEDVDELLPELDGFEVEVGGRTRTLNTDNAFRTLIEMSALERFLLFVTDPNVIALLLSIGPIAIIAEIRSPGGWALGVIGVVCLGLAFYGLGVMPVNWLGIVFIGLAIVLFILEISAPTHGILTATGAASLAAGAIILFNQPEIAPFGQLSIPLVIGQSVVIGGVFFAFMVVALRAQSKQPTTGREGLIGQIGRVTQDLNPTGTVLVWGERWKAESIDGENIPFDSEVEIVEADRMRLRVRPKSAEIDNRL